MPLEFKGDAISLRGLTGTKLKCDVIGEYYRFWWNITSGGPSVEHRYPTAFVELDAATGEVYIKDTDETVLGSAGHSMELKATGPSTGNLKVILIEKDPGCYANLKKVIQKRWPSVVIAEAEKPISENSSNVYLFNLGFDDAIEQVKQIELGNSLFFFDPLRSVTWRSVEKVTEGRIGTYYQTGTEFMIFIFTSDWFLGRDELAPLPDQADETKWTEQQRYTVAEADSLFGDQSWRAMILTLEPTTVRESKLIELYRKQLHKWFRYVLPLPFNPKKNQLFHLILCSNYEIGVRMTKDYYSKQTGNPPYKPDNRAAYDKFKRLHRELTYRLIGAQRPAEWKMLWKIITQHEEGLCDCQSRDLIAEADFPEETQTNLKWLKENGYLVESDIKDAWNSEIKQYVLNWPILISKLGIAPPLPLKPLSPEMLRNGRG
jgi:three-Cys-motif partner protein